jgi:hypothetical protein
VGNTVFFAQITNDHSARLTQNAKQYTRIIRGDGAGDAEPLWTAAASGLPSLAYD